MWVEITYQTVEVSERMHNISPYLYWPCDYLFMFGFKLIYVSKGALVCARWNWNQESRLKANTCGHLYITRKLTIKVHYDLKLHTIYLHILFTHSPSSLTNHRVPVLLKLKCCGICICLTQYWMPQNTWDCLLFNQLEGVTQAISLRLTFQQFEK